MNYYIGQKTIIEEKKKKDQLINLGYGEQKQGKLILDEYETLFLLEQKKIQIKDKTGKKIESKDILKKSKSKDFLEKYQVYQDIRKNGLVIKTGQKFGFDYRVYPRGKKMGEQHSEYVIQVTTQNKKIAPVEISRMVRLSQSLKTKFILAIVDSENEIIYYKINREKF